MMRASTMLPALLLGLALLSHAQASSPARKLFQDGPMDPDTFAAAAATPSQTRRYTLVTFSSIKDKNGCWDTCQTRKMFPEMDTNFDPYFWDEYNGDETYQSMTAMCAVRVRVRNTTVFTTFYGSTNIDTTKKTASCSYIDSTGKNAASSSFQCVCNPTCDANKDDDCYNDNVLGKWWRTTVGSQSATCSTSCTKGCICSIKDANAVRRFGYTVAGRTTRNTCRAGGQPLMDSSRTNRVSFSSVCRL